MGDSACLIRSFSHPVAASLEPNEGDPIRALTESVSFGRFMSESLAWEKWSTFSHNRYLEEVEKFTKPGSVAQKKAFFEAHYKRRAAMRAISLAEDANTSGNDSLQMENASPISPSNTVPENAKASVVIDDRQIKDLPATNEVETTSGTARNHSIDGDNHKIQNGETSQEISYQNVSVEIPRHVEISKHLENADKHDMIAATPDAKVSRKESADQKKSGSSTKRRQTISSKPSSNCGTSKFPVPSSVQMTPVQAKGGINIVGISQRSSEGANNKRRMIPKTLHTSINFVSCSENASKTSFRMPTSPHTLTKVRKKVAGQNSLALPSKKSQSNSTLTLSIHSSRMGNRDTVVGKETIYSSNEEKRMVSKSNSKSFSFSKSVSKSINFTSRASEISRKATKTPRESSLSLLQTPSRASINDGQKHLPSDILSEDKRCWKSPSGSKAQAVTKFSPFRFRSEERAERRKEKMEEKNNSMATEKAHLPTRFKEKQCNSLNKLWQSNDFKAKPKEELYQGAESSSNQTKKIPLTQPWPVKAGVNQSSSRVQDSTGGHLPPRRPSINTERSKHVAEKNRRRIISLVTSVPKIRRENASPNIQLSDAKEGISCKHGNGGSVGS